MAASPAVSSGCLPTAFARTFRCYLSAAVLEGSMKAAPSPAILRVGGTPVGDPDDAATGS
jgi:hypothetical protein